MAVNPTKLFDGLAKLVQSEDKANFIYGFLRLFDTPKATITKLQNQTPGTNVAAPAWRNCPQPQTLFQTRRPRFRHIRRPARPETIRHSRQKQNPLLYRNRFSKHRRLR